MNMRCQHAERCNFKGRCDHRDEHERHWRCVSGFCTGYGRAAKCDEVKDEKRDEVKDRACTCGHAPSMMRCQDCTPDAEEMKRMDSPLKEIERMALRAVHGHVPDAIARDNAEWVEAALKHATKCQHCKGSGEDWLGGDCLYCRGTGRAQTKNPYGPHIGADGEEEQTMAFIEVEGKKYRVLDSLGFVHSAGAYAKEIETDSGPQIVVKHSGVWRFWTRQDRVAPLVEAACRAEKLRREQRDRYADGEEE